MLTASDYDRLRNAEIRATAPANSDGSDYLNGSMASFVVLPAPFGSMTIVGYVFADDVAQLAQIPPGNVEHLVGGCIQYIDSETGYAAQMFISGAVKFAANHGSGLQVQLNVGPKIAAGSPVLIKFPLVPQGTA